MDKKNANLEKAACAYLAEPRSDEVMGVYPIWEMMCHTMLPQSTVPSHPTPFSFSNI